MDLWDRIKMFINSGYRIPAAYILNRWPDLHKFQFFPFRNQLCSRISAFCSGGGREGERVLWVGRHTGTATGGCILSGKNRVSIS